MLLLLLLLSPSSPSSLLFEVLGYNSGSQRDSILICHVTWWEIGLDV
jgi:hypothetical protein